MEYPTLPYRSKVDCVSGNYLCYKLETRSLSCVGHLIEYSFKDIRVSKYVIRMGRMRYDIRVVVLEPLCILCHALGPRRVGMRSPNTAYVSDGYVRVCE